MCLPRKHVNHYLFTCNLYAPVNYVIINSDNGLWLVRNQAFSLTSVWFCFCFACVFYFRLIAHFGTNFNEILTKIQEHDFENV